MWCNYNILCSTLEPTTHLEVFRSSEHHRNNHVDDKKVGKFSFFKRDAQIGEISFNVSCSGKASGEYNRSCGFVF
jgi:hypothetical protein